MAIPKIAITTNAVEEVTTKLVFRFAEHVKNSFVLVLRAAFAHEQTPEEYRYAPPKTADETPSDAEPGEVKQLSIYRTHPKREAMLPAIIVKTAPGDASVKTLNNEEGVECRDDDNNITGLIYTGTMTLPVTLEVIAQSATDRERLGDLLLSYVRFAFRRKFMAEQMPYLSIEGGETGEEDDGGGETRYLAEVNILVQTEFDAFMDQTLLDLITSINFGGMRFGVTGDDFTPNQEEPTI